MWGMSPEMWRAIGAGGPPPGPPECYRCPTCETFGHGDACWSCGEVEGLERGRYAVIPTYGALTAANYRDSVEVVESLIGG